MAPDTIAEKDARHGAGIHGASILFDARISCHVYDARDAGVSRPTPRSFMAESDLSKLRIDRSAPQSNAGTRRRRRVWRWSIVAVLALVLAYFASTYRPSIAVET